MLEVFRVPVCLPGRVMETLESLAAAVGEVGAIRSELTRVRVQSEPLAARAQHIVRQTNDLLGRAVETRLDALHEVITALEGDESHLNSSVGDLGRQLAAMQETVVGLQRDVERITDRLPDPSRGPLDKARDALTGDAAR